MEATSLGEQGQEDYGSKIIFNRFLDFATSSESSNYLASSCAAVSFNCTKLLPRVSNRKFDDWPSTLPTLFLGSFSSGSCMTRARGVESSLQAAWCPMCHACAYNRPRLSPHTEDVRHYRPSG